MKSVGRLMVLIVALSAVETARAREVVVGSDRLEVTLGVPEGLLTVRDREAATTWRQYLPRLAAIVNATSDVQLLPIAADRLIRIDNARAVGTSIEASATWRGLPFSIRYRILDSEDSLEVSIDTPRRAESLPLEPDWMGVRLMNYPYTFYSERSSPFAVVPIDEGVIYSTHQADPNSDPRRWKLWWLHQKLSMPWFGLTDLEHGVMTRVDTPLDCMMSIDWIETPAGQRTVPQVTWVASKGALAYPRRTTFRFLAHGGYVAMAKAFRQSVVQSGQFRSWEEKILANPDVEKLRGALDLWHQEPIGPELIEQLQQSGVRRAIVSKVGRGNPEPGEGITPEAIRAAERAGYLVGRYHNYSWIQGRWIDEDPALADLAVLPAGGKLKYTTNAWDPKGRLDRCAAAHGEVFRRIGTAERKLGVNYFFTDCTTTGGAIHDCYHPDHPVDREGSVAGLTSALDELAGLGLVVGSERGKWWAAGSAHVFEGIETLIDYGGRYYGSGNESHWVGPYLEDKPGYRELFLGYDFNPARRLPLFQLVYHDSVYCTRRWNQDPGRDPRLWDRHDLINVLYGTPALWFMHPAAGNVIGTPNWEEVKDRYLKTYQTVCGWHEKIGFDEMTDHRFLSPDRLVQETSFSSGRAAVVNFSQNEWRDPRGFSVAPGSCRFSGDE